MALDPPVATCCSFAGPGQGGKPFQEEVTHYIEGSQPRGGQVGPDVNVSPGHTEIQRGMAGTLLGLCIPEKSPLFLPISLALEDK